MKIRILAILLALFTFVGSLSSCAAFIVDGIHGLVESESVPIETDVLSSDVGDDSSLTEPPVSETVPAGADTEPAETEPKDTEPAEEGVSFEELLAQIDYPDVYASKLELPKNVYLNDVNIKIRKCEDIFYINKKSDTERLKRALCDAYVAVQTVYMQYRIAYFIYCTDLSAEDARQSYYNTYDLYTQADELFDDMLAFRNESKWVHAPVFKEFHDILYPDTIYSKPGTDPTTCRQTMVDIERKVNAYNFQGKPEEIIGLFTEYISASNEYAQAFGYDNYYEYVGERTYNRDYGRAEREKLRKYVKKYIIPFCGKLQEASNKHWRTLTSAEKDESKALDDASYESFAINYPFEYFDSLPAAVGEKMKSAMTKDRVLIGKGDNAMDIAFQGMVGDTPMCYFRYDYMDIKTISHEFGHYYYDLVSGGADCSPDLLEVHSQANVLLMANYMNTQYGTPAIKDFVAEEILNALYVIIILTIYDEFEEIVFSDPNSNKYTVKDVNRIIGDLIEKYRVLDYVSGLDDDIREYWYQRGIYDVGYSISYATSAVAALQIYQKSLADYDAAVECYRKTVEEIDPESTFLGTLKNAGLLSPFDEECFKEIRKISLF